MTKKYIIMKFLLNSLYLVPACYMLHNTGMCLELNICCFQFPVNVLMRNDESVHAALFKNCSTEQSTMDIKVNQNFYMHDIHINNYYDKI